LENTKFLWLAKEIYIWGLGNRKLVFRNLDAEYIEDRWGTIAGGYLIEVLGSHRISPKLVRAKWRVLGEVPLARGELSAQICLPIEKREFKFKYRKILENFNSEHGTDCELVFESDRRISSGRHQVDEILFIGSEEYLTAFSAVPQVFVATRIGKSILVHTFRGVWLDLTAGREYSVELYGLFWPTIEQIKKIKKASPINVSSQQKFFSETGETVSLEIGGRIRVLVNGEDKDETLRINAIVHSRVYDELVSLARDYGNMHKYLAIHRAFSCLSSVIPKKLLHVLAFYMRYTHIDEYRAWFFDIRKIEDFDTYLRYARRLRSKYGLLDGRGPEWKVIQEKLGEIIDKAIHKVFACWLGRPQLAKYLREITNKDTILPSKFAEEIGVTPTRIRQVLNTLRIYGFIIKKNKTWLVRKDKVSMYIFSIRRLLEDSITKPEILEKGFIAKWILKIFDKAYIFGGLPRFVPMVDSPIIGGLDLLEGEPIALRILIPTLIIPIPAFILPPIRILEKHMGDPDLHEKAILGWNIFNVATLYRSISHKAPPEEFIGLYHYLLLNRSRIFGDIYLGPANLGGIYVGEFQDILLR